jgi:GSH-dependent disulfide-bond oxidoreductase
MIDFYYWPTPNGWKVSIMLEETGLPYNLVPVNIGKGDQFKPEFMAISPNNRMPAIVDHDARSSNPARSCCIWRRKRGASLRPIRAGGRK